MEEWLLDHKVPIDDTALSFLAVGISYGLSLVMDQSFEEIHDYICDQMTVMDDAVI